MTEQIEIVRTVDVVAAEIRALTASMLSNVIEIGRRMYEAKELLPHGEFGRWLEEQTGYSTSTASNFMRLYKEYGAEQGSLFGPEIKCQTFGKLSYSKALALLSVPAEEREMFVQQHDVEAMSTRELQKAIKERDEALKRAEQAEQDAEEARSGAEGSALAMAEMEDKLQAVQDKLKDTREARDEIAAFLRERTEEVEELKAEVKQLQERPVEVAVQEPDPAVVEQAVDAAKAQMAEQHKGEMDQLMAKLDKQAKENAKLEKKLREAKVQAANTEDAAERQRLQEQVEQLRKQLVMSGVEITTFRVKFAAWQQAYTEMSKALEELPKEDRVKMKAAVKAQVKAWVKDDGED